jgi:hypothetical protein
MLFLALSVLSSAADWAVEEAPLRFALKLTRPPTHASCGYFVKLPDGGLLPTPFPLTKVLSPSGKPLASHVMWHNRGTGLGLVIEDPGREKEIHVYVQPARRLRLWSADSGITPSAILAADPGVGKQAAARTLAGLGAVGPAVHYRNHAGIGKAPLSVGGDLSGRSRPGSFYLLAYLVSADPGKTWIAPFTLDGSTDMQVNGQPLVPRQRIDKWGGTGQYVDLKKGLNRFDIFQVAGGSGAYGGGLMYLSWRPPKASMKELGGVRPKGAPHAGTSMMETRLVRDNEIARSGAAEIQSIQARDGRPVAAINLQPREVFWFADEAPVIIYELAAMTEGNPGDTRYTWKMEGGATLSGPGARWLFTGQREHRLSLSARSGDKETRVIQPFFAHSTLRTSLNDPETRARYRDTVLQVFEAYPGDVDPTASWSSGHWNNLFRSLELGQDPALLTHVFRVRWETFRQKLSPSQRALMLEIFLQSLPVQDPDRALKWIGQIARLSDDPGDTGLIQIRAAEIYLYYKADPERARKLLEPILMKRGRDDVSEWARIRYGDIEFISGDLNKATRMYGDVQSRAGHTLGEPGTPGNAAPAPMKGVARNKAEMEAQRQARLARMKAVAAQAAAAPSSETSFALIDNQHIADWKINALVDAAASETVKELVEQGYLLEAKHAIRDWERSFPLSKLSSDYILVEAHFYMALKDWGRAHAILEPYCELVDASSFIPPAVEALLECKQALHMPADEMIAFCEAMKKKLEFHPAARKLDAILKELQAGGR